MLSSFVMVYVLAKMSAPWWCYVVTVLHFIASIGNEFRLAKTEDDIQYIDDELSELEDSDE